MTEPLATPENIAAMLGVGLTKSDPPEPAVDFLPALEQEAKRRQAEAIDQHRDPETGRAVQSESPDSDRGSNRSTDLTSESADTKVSDREAGEPVGVSERTEFARFFAAKQEANRRLIESLHGPFADGAAVSRALGGGDDA